MLINLDDNQLDTIYKALLELPGKFSHALCSHIEREVVRVNAEAKSTEEKARAEATQKAIDDALAKTKAEAEGTKTIRAYDPASDPLAAPAPAE